MSAQQPRNPMGLNELRELLVDINSTLEQVREAIEATQGEHNQQGLLATLYTKTLMVKLQVQADMERLS